MKYCRKLAAILLLMAITAVVINLPVQAEERKLGEYEVKAVFLYNMAKFIEWPDKSLDNGSTLTIYILGDDPFGANLDVIKGKLVKGKTVFVKQIDSPDILRDVGILFVSRSEKDQLPDILKGISGKPILTVGDTVGFAKRGVMVNFYLEDNKIRFEINMEAARLAGLKISSNLLKIGKIISPPTGKEK